MKTSISDRHLSGIGSKNKQKFNKNRSPLLEQSMTMTGIMQEHIDEIRDHPKLFIPTLLESLKSKGWDKKFAWAMLSEIGDASTIPKLEHIHKTSEGVDKHLALNAIINIELNEMDHNLLRTCSSIYKETN